MDAIQKLDLKRKYKVLFNPSPRQVSIVEVPALNYVMIDGSGDPNTAQEYQDAVAALYSAAYTLKFMIKKGETALPPVDYAVMALEGLWWSDDLSTFSMARKHEWKWTMMIMQPEFVTARLVAQAVEKAARKKELPALPRLRFEPYAEGLCAQIMHLGPYDDEPPTIAKLHAFITDNGYRLGGKHHEIYLSDPRKTAPSRMKTVLRQPIRN
jgi:hypothetical protein